MWGGGTPSHLPQSIYPNPITTTQLPKPSYFNPITQIQLHPVDAINKQHLHNDRHTPQQTRTRTLTQMGVRGCRQGHYRGGRQGHYCGCRRLAHQSLKVANLDYTCERCPTPPPTKQTTLCGKCHSRFGTHPNACVKHRLHMRPLTDPASDKENDCLQAMLPSDRQPTPPPTNQTAAGRLY